MTIAYDELWMLERAAEAPAWVPLAWLYETANEELTAHHVTFNCPTHGLSNADIAGLLFRLWQSGLIEIVATGSKPYTHTQADALRSWFKEFIPRDAFPATHGFRMTDKGMSRWESYAQPDWDHCRTALSVSKTNDGGSFWKLSTATQEFGRELLEMWAAGSVASVRVNWGTLECQQHQPWSPCGGKTLPTGVTLQVEITPRGNRPITAAEEAAALALNAKFAALPDWYSHGTFNHPNRPMSSVDCTAEELWAKKPD